MFNSFLLNIFTTKFAQQIKDDIVRMNLKSRRISLEYFLRSFLFIFFNNFLLQDENILEILVPSKIEML